MKKIFITIFALFLFVAVVPAQNSDVEKLMEDIKALAGDGVYCEAYEMNSYVREQFISQLGQQFGEEGVEKLMEHFPIAGKGKRIILLETNNIDGYHRVASFVEKNEIDTADELYGIPLMVNSRNEGEQQIVFLSDDYTFVFNDNADENTYEICASDCNIIELLQKTMLTVVEAIGESSFDVVFNDDDNASYTFSAEDDSDEYAKVYADIMIKKTVKKSAGPLYNDSITEPALLPNGAGDYRVAIPTLSEDDKKECRPYAVSGVYDWINETGFGKGGGENPHQKSEIITPFSVVKEYFRAHDILPLSIEHPSDDLCKHLAAEYQGGAPALLYRKSLTPEGYEDILSDLAPFFALKDGERYKNMKVVNRYDSPSGERFVQLYGERSVLVCIYDSPTEKRCCMSITIGDSDAFASVVNSYRSAEERVIARKCRITIGDNGIQFSAGNLMNPRGLFYNLDYYNKINYKQ